MQMDIKRRPMRTLPIETQLRICRCPTRCKFYLHLDGYGRYCENTALDIAYDIFAVAKKLKRPKSRSTYQTWHTVEEQFIKNWYEKGAKYGDRRVIAGILGRDYKSVSAKIDNMKERGKL